MQGKKEKDMYVKVYDVQEKNFSNQTRQFLAQSQSIYKYIMIIVDINSNGILVKLPFMQINIIQWQWKTLARPGRVLTHPTNQVLTQQR